MNGRGREYASALFELALEGGSDTLLKVWEDLQAVREVFAKTPEFSDFLLSPAIPVNERKELVEKTFGEFHEYVSSFILLLTEKGHVRDLDETVNTFNEFFKESTNRSEAVVTSAAELSEEQKIRLKTTLEKKSGKRVDITYRTDKKLIGGMIVQMDGTVMDGSIRKRLKDIKEVMEQ